MASLQINSRSKFSEILPMNDILVLDLETTVERIEGRIDNSPYNPHNKIVSAHFGWLGWDDVDDYQCPVYYHVEQPQSDSTESLREALRTARLLVCHNAKFDVSWLLEAGFDVPEIVYCTMIGEYLLAKAQRKPLSLKACAERRGLRNQKKSDLIDHWFRDGVDFSEMPLATMLEYAEADVRTTAELYLSQIDEFDAQENKSLITARDQMNDMLIVLVELERNGCAIDLDALETVENEFQQEKTLLVNDLTRIGEKVMGDKPFNLNSGDDMSELVYSRIVVDKPLHKQTFNIGTNDAGKSLRPPLMSNSQFSDAVRVTTKVSERTNAVCCSVCSGFGSIQKFKVKTKTKLGKKYRIQTEEPYKNRTKCQGCNGVGAIYQPTGQTAGLKMIPFGPDYAAAGGFKTDKVTIQKLIEVATRKNKAVAVEFLTKLSRLSAVTVYLDSFVAGLKRGTRKNGILHANFNQCIASTGRLSSSNPNAQNWPKRGFPVRRAIISRFDGGNLIECDYSGLEFRTCVELSRDAQGLADILQGKDIHAQSASIILQKPASEVSKEERQTVGKPNTFLPLFGGTGYGSPEHVRAYFGRFYEIYEGIHAWHKQLQTGVLKNGIVQTPSGRQYYWPNVVRRSNGGVSNGTQILNYPVQGFSADMVQLACIRAFRLFKQSGLRSKMILTVHDSIVVDTHPDETEEVKSILVEAMTRIDVDMETRYKYKPVVPFNVEITMGKNWLDQEELSLTNAT